MEGDILVVGTIALQFSPKENCMSVAIFSKGMNAFLFGIPSVLFYIIVYILPLVIPIL